MSQVENAFEYRTTKKGTAIAVPFFSGALCFLFRVLSWRNVEASVGGVVAVGHFLGGVDFYLFDP